MKFATVSKVVVMGLTLVLACGAFAASKANLTLDDTTNVNGTQLKAGDYKLEWDGSGPTVEVSIVQGKKVITKVPARIIELDKAPSNNAAVLKQDANGMRTLSGARFSGKKLALELGESAEGMQSGSSR